MAAGKINLENCSGWIKFAIVWTYIQFGLTIATILLYAIIGLSSLE